MSKRKSSLLQDIRILSKAVSSKRRIQLAALLFLQVLSSISEIISIGAIMPFLSALTNAEKLLHDERMKIIVSILDIQNSNQLIIAMATTFAIAIICANILRFTTMWLQLKLSWAIGTDLGVILYRKTLDQPYSYFVKNNSSEIIGNMTHDLNATIGVVQGIITIFSQAILISFILASLLAYNPAIAIMLGMTVFSAYIIITILIKTILHRNSTLISDGYRGVIRTTQESIGSIRNILIHNSKLKFLKDYEKFDRQYRIASANNNMLKQAPRFFVETISVISMCILSIYFIFQSNDITQIIPLMGFLGLASYRLLPAIQMIFSSVSAIIGLEESVNRTSHLFKQPEKLVTITPNQFKDFKEIAFKNIKFSYYDTPKKDKDWTIKGLSFSIKKNTISAFVGQTGSGKSTISDLILGLIEPNSGQILINNQPLTKENMPSWQHHISHVPQNIYLTDAPISENIAFGVNADNIDMELVKKSAQMAQIDDFIDTLPNGYQEIVGERGVKLSGGQLQRIGIARALYSQPSLIIFDEATSALDNNTEREVMSSLNNLSGEITIILIAHRLSTVKNADVIFMLDNGKIVANSSYDKLLENSYHFKNLIGNDQF